MCSSMCVYIYLHVSVEARGWLQIFSSVGIHLVFRLEPLTEPGALQLVSLPD